MAKSFAVPQPPTPTMNFKLLLLTSLYALATEAAVPVAPPLPPGAVAAAPSIPQAPPAPATNAPKDKGLLAGLKSKKAKMDASRANEPWVQEQLQREQELRQQQQFVQQQQLQQIQQQQQMQQQQQPFQFQQQPQQLFLGGYSGEGYRPPQKRRRDREFYDDNDEDFEERDEGKVSKLKKKLKKHKKKLISLKRRIRMMERAYNDLDMGDDQDDDYDVAPVYHPRYRRAVVTPPPCQPIIAAPVPATQVTPVTAAQVTPVSAAQAVSAPALVTQAPLTAAPLEDGKHPVLVKVRDPNQPKRRLYELKLVQ